MIQPVVAVIGALVLFALAFPFIIAAVENGYRRYCDWVWDKLGV